MRIFPILILLCLCGSPALNAQVISSVPLEISQLPTSHSTSHSKIYSFLSGRVTGAADDHDAYNYLDMEIVDFNGGGNSGGGADVTDTHYERLLPNNTGYRVSVNPNTALTDMLCGVSAFNATYLERVLAGTYNLSLNFQYVAADVNRDGVINSLDVDYIRDATLNGNTDGFASAWVFPTKESVDNGGFSLSNVNYPTDKLVFLPRGGSSGNDFYAVKIGSIYTEHNCYHEDVSGGVDGKSVTETPASLPGMDIALPNTTLAAGESVLFPIDLALAKGGASIYLSLGFDPSLVAVEELVPAGIDPAANTYSVNPASGVFKSLLFQNEIADAKDGQPLFYLRLRAKHDLSSLQDAIDYTEDGGAIGKVFFTAPDGSLATGTIQPVWENMIDEMGEGMKLTTSSMEIPAKANSTPAAKRLSGAGITLSGLVHSPDANVNFDNRRMAVNYAGSDFETDVSGNNFSQQIPMVLLGRNLIIGVSPLVENVFSPDDMREHKLCGLTITDLNLLYGHISGNNLLATKEQKIAADINRDLRINIADYILLYRAIYFDEDFRIPDGWVFPTVTSFFITAPYDSWVWYWDEYYENNVTTDQNLLDFIGLKVGDLNFSCTEYQSLPGVAGVAGKSGLNMPQTNTTELGKHSINMSNPFYSEMNVTVYTDATSAANFSLFDLSGKEVLQQTEQLHAGHNTFDVVNLAYLPAGTYAYRLTGLSEGPLSGIVVKQ